MLFGRRDKKKCYEPLVSGIGFKVESTPCIEYELEDEYNEEEQYLRISLVPNDPQYSTSHVDIPERTLVYNSETKELVWTNLDGSEGSTPFDIQPKINRNTNGYGLEFQILINGTVVGSSFISDLTNLVYNPETNELTLTSFTGKIITVELNQPEQIRTKSTMSSIVLEQPSIVPYDNKVMLSGKTQVTSNDIIKVIEPNNYFRYVGKDDTTIRVRSTLNIRNNHPSTSQYINMNFSIGTRESKLQSFKTIGYTEYNVTEEVFSSFDNSIVYDTVIKLKHGDEFGLFVDSNEISNLYISTGSIILMNED